MHPLFLKKLAKVISAFKKTSLILKFSGNKEYNKKLKKLLGFKPGDITIYQSAFTHRSAKKGIKRHQKVQDNERLEFLGDSILDAIISDYLYKLYPNHDEGFLTNMRSKIVNGSKLSELAEFLSLPDFLEYNVNSFTSKKHLYEDSFEALIGAIYLDKGYEFAFKFVKSKILSNLVDVKELESIDLNYKSQLIELVQKHHKKVNFSTTKHDQDDKLFVAVVKVEEKEVGFGLGVSKKQAEQKAAQEALIRLEQK